MPVFYSKLQSGENNLFNLSSFFGFDATAYAFYFVPQKLVRGKFDQFVYQKLKIYSYANLLEKNKKKRT